MRSPRTAEVRFRLEHHKFLLGALCLEVTGGANAREARPDNEYVEVLKFPIATHGRSKRFGQFRSLFAQGHISRRQLS
jgi:hypothetical protein